MAEGTIWIIKVDVEMSDEEAKDSNHSWLRVECPVMPDTSPSVKVIEEEIFSNVGNEVLKAESAQHSR